MRKEIKCLPVLWLLCLAANAQLVPAPGAVLNYTQVMFEYDKEKTADAYLIQVTEDTVDASTIDPRKTSNDSPPLIPLSALQFQKPLIEQTDSTTATMVSGLQFGKKYLWRFTRIENGRQTGWNGPYGFEIKVRNDADVSLQPVAVIDQTDKHAGGLIVADFQSIIDRTGKPVWQMPAARLQKIVTMNTRDLTVTPFGTITFLSANNEPVECDLQGNILWRAPDNGKVSGDTTEYYHHDFQRLKNGNYMLLGDKFVWKKVPVQYIEHFKKMEADRNNRMPGAPQVAPPVAMPQTTKYIEGIMYARIRLGTIIEYNAKGEVVWSWNSDTYLKDEETFPLLVNGLPVLPQPGNVSQPGRAVNLANTDPDAHLNSFSADDKNEFVYAGFRQLSRVIKINRATGKVINSWGDKLSTGEAKDGDGFFKFQHGAKVMKDGRVLVFNNGDAKLNQQPSSAVIFDQPNDNTASKIIWEYKTVFDSLPEKSSRGGNADELPSGNILICMGMGPLGTGRNAPPVMPPNPVGTAPAALPHAGSPIPLTRIVEVNRNNEIVWSARLNKSAYRAHYVSSLYPNYFTAKISAPYTTGHLLLTVYNEGTENDSYNITVKVTKTGKTETFILPEVAAGAHRDLNVAPVKLPVAGEPVEITVASATNPANTRLLKAVIK